ncbi:MAG: hypothetical protein WC523_00165 [Patescibacteria group bacterium]
MPKKKVDGAEGHNVSVKNLSMADLYALYMFVSANWNRGFGAGKKNAEKVIEAKMKEIEEELYSRAYGRNPFVAEKIVSATTTIEGQLPEQVLASLPIVKFDGEEKTEQKPQSNFIIANKDIKEENTENSRFIVADKNK